MCEQLQTSQTLAGSFFGGHIAAGDWGRLLGIIVGHIGL